MISRANIEECLELLRMAYYAADDVIVARQIRHVYKQIEREESSKRSEYNTDRMRLIGYIQHNGIVINELCYETKAGQCKETQYLMKDESAVYCVYCVNGYYETVQQVKVNIND